MLIYNKYKPTIYLNSENILLINLPIVSNTNKISNEFKYSKKLIRSLILLHFYIYSYNPFSFLFYKGLAKYCINLNNCLLLLVSPDCYKNYLKNN